jgi:hypothetical protein
MSQQDAGSDAPQTCGTEVCMGGTVCCLKKIAPFASCIPPEDFGVDQCESMMVKASCITPADCDAGQVCCLDENAPSINCLAPGMCPGDGIGTGRSGTYLTCATYRDCPTQAPGLCTPVPGTDGGLNVCAPQ